MAAPTKSTASVWDYIKHGFLYRWNLLLFVGGAGLAAMSPWPDAMLPILAGLELSYLGALMAMPRFRTAIDAKVLAGSRARSSQAGQEDAAGTLRRLLDSLPATSLRRFIMLRQRCFDMRAIASGVRGQAAFAPDTPDSLRAPALDRLLFLFLKLLVSQDALMRFLKTTSEPELAKRLADVKTRLEAAQAAGDQRLIHSLTDSVADAELRLENYRKSARDSAFVDVELDRIETKIHALTELGVSRQDPDTLSHQVSAVADSMEQTELAVDQLRHLTGLADHLQETPPILEADLDAPVTRGK